MDERRRRVRRMERVVRSRQEAGLARDWDIECGWVGRPPRKRRELLPAKPDAPFARQRERRSVRNLLPGNDSRR